MSGLNPMPMPMETQGLGGRILGTVAENALRGISNFNPIGLGMNILGGAASWLMNKIGVNQQNKQQEEFYNKYLSPSARMRQMVEAGINPNLAAQGIAGASSPGMVAASMSQGAGTAGQVGQMLGNSFNNALQAQNIAANTENVDTRTTGNKIENKNMQRLIDSVIDENVSKKNLNDDQGQFLKTQNYIEGRKANDLVKLAKELARKAENEANASEKDKALKESEIGENKASASEKAANARVASAYAKQLENVGVTGLDAVILTGLGPGATDEEKALANAALDAKKAVENAITTGRNEAESNYDYDKWVNHLQVSSSKDLINEFQSVEKDYEKAGSDYEYFKKIGANEDTLEYHRRLKNKYYGQMKGIKEQLEKIGKAPRWMRDKKYGWNR